MQIVLQRVSRAAVHVNGEVVGTIRRGLVALVGVGHRSTERDAAWLAAKTQGLRIFADEQRNEERAVAEAAVGGRGRRGDRTVAEMTVGGRGARMNRSVAEIGGGVLVISQFTLYADTRKGRRPSFVDAAAPERAESLYEAYCEALTVPVAKGVFGAYMDIEMVADGPVTILLARETG